jgi:chemotaxis protein MotB
MNFLKSLLIIIAVAFFTVTACVPGRQYEEVKAQRDKLLAEQQGLRGSSQSAEEENKELKTKVETLERNVKALQEDTTFISQTNRKLRLQYDKLLALNDQLLDKTNQARTGTEAERQQLMVQLDVLKSKLEAKEDSLVKLDLRLRDREESLKDREAKIDALTKMIADKDKSLTDLKDRLVKALAGYEDKGLSVEQKNGRVYVNMEAKLLFASGSTAVGAEGKGAVVKLAKAIEDQKDLNIVIEGHTDTDKITSGGKIPRDNWELSVLRATEVVKIMTENSSINPNILTAAGRSEYLPVDPGDKAKNRRIEFVLTPNLDQIMDLLEE